MEIIQKDITTVTKGVLINGVNCQNAMGSGVARAYFERWPQVKSQYHDRHDQWIEAGVLDSEKYLGAFDAVKVDHNLYVANCWTQQFFGSDGKPYARYTAIFKSVGMAAEFARDHGLEIYTPWVGCGLGGLDQTKVTQTLEALEDITKVPFTVCEL